MAQSARRNLTFKSTGKGLAAVGCSRSFSGWALLIVGNLVLFSGAWTTNWVATLFALVGLVADAVFVGAFVRRFRIGSSSGHYGPGANTAQAERNAPPRAKQRDATSHKTTKTARESGMHKRVTAFRAQYRLPPLLQLGRPVRFDAPDRLRYREVIDAVYTCKNAMQLVLSDRLDCDVRLREILSCTACKTDRQRMRHLKSHKKELDGLYGCSAMYTQELAQQKIELFDRDPTLTTDMYQAFAYLLSAVDAKGVAPAKDFVATIDPLDARLFVSERKPAQIRMGSFTFALYSSVILVFDASGTFTTALRPHAFSFDRRYRSQIPTLRFAIGSVSQEVPVSDAAVLRAVWDTAERYMKSESATFDRMPQLIALLELVSDSADPDLASVKAVCAQNGVTNQPICAVHTTR